MTTFNVKKILVPLDFSLTSIKALNQAVTMAKINKAEITIMHVIEGLPATTEMKFIPTGTTTDPGLQEKEVRAQSNQNLEKLAQRLRKKEGVKINTVTVSGRTHKQIIDVAAQTKADLIIMGTHGTSGFREFVLGSNTYRVVSEAKCPVLSIHQHSIKPGFKKILLPFRDKPHSREKVDYAIRIAEIFKATIHVVGVDVDDSGTQFQKLTLEAEQIKKIIEKHDINCKTKVIVGQYLSGEVMNYAKGIKADLIVVMADLDRMSISEFILGPFVQQIINHSPIPVLSIRPRFNPNTVDLHGYGW